MRHREIRKREDSKAGGFTLVELLVCMGVIVLLASLLIPGMSSLTARAQRVSCLNQVRQLGTALISYTGDNNGVGPYDAREAEAGNTSISLWKYHNQKVLFGLLLPYLGAENSQTTPKVLICPGASHSFRQMLASSGDNTSYWMNPDVSSNPNNTKPIITLPGSRVAFMDSCTWWQPGIFGPDYDNHLAQGINVFRLNGSVSWIPMAQTKGLPEWDWTQLDKL